MNLSIPRAAFQAAVHCAAVKDVRYYLNGACLRIDGDKAQVYSTDGHVLFCCRFDVTDDDLKKGPFDILIPIEAVKHAAKRGSEFVELVSLDNGVYLLDGLQFTAIDGKYPPIDRVIPDKDIEPSIGNYDPALLLKIHKALRAWYDHKNGFYRLTQNGPKSAIMQGPDNTAIAAIMPIRVDESPPMGFPVMGGES